MTLAKSRMRGPPALWWLFCLKKAVFIRGRHTVTKIQNFCWSRRWEMTGRCSQPWQSGLSAVCTIHNEQTRSAWTWKPHWEKLFMNIEYVINKVCYCWCFRGLQKDCIIQNYFRYFATGKWIINQGLILIWYHHGIMHFLKQFAKQKCCLKQNTHGCISRLDRVC